MTHITGAPDLSGLEIPIDSWTQPFWDATAEEKLLLPRCSACHGFRWPPGPFCPHCQSQRTEWIAPGIARIFSFTILRARGETQPAPLHVPALIEFLQADGVRILGAIVETQLTLIHIGAQLRVAWSQAVNAKVPVFTVQDADAIRLAAD